MREIRDVLRVLSELMGRLPEGATSFLVNELFKAKIRNVVLTSGALGLVVKGMIAGFDCEKKEILVDLDRNLDRYRETIYQRHGLELDEKEAFLFLLLHEVSHAKLGADECKADENAKRLFLEWIQIRDAVGKEQEASRP